MTPAPDKADAHLPPPVVAIDGPAASGKGTLARRIAARFGFAHLDSGLLYRGVALALIRAGTDPEDPALAERAEEAARALSVEALNDPALREDATGNLAGRIAVFPAVRDALKSFQQAFAAAPPAGSKGVVIDGRDIGTVICPDATAKIFLEADVEVRAERRAKELQERDADTIHSAVLRDMKERDARDRGRAVAPLEAAKDALTLDTTSLDADQVFAATLSFMASKGIADGA